MTYTFQPSLHREFRERAVLISGNESSHYQGVDYLIIEDESGEKRSYEIRYQDHSSSFKKAYQYDHVLAVGHEHNFYLFDITQGKNLLVLDLNMYAEEIYEDEKLLYISDGCVIFCIDFSGNIIWTSPHLGVDGVIISSFTNDFLYGTAELDPPGGWKDFIVDKKTGGLINWID